MKPQGELTEKKNKKLKYRLLQLGKLLAITLLTSKLDVTQCQWLSMLVFSPEVIVIVVMIKLLQGEISHYEGGATWLKFPYYLDGYS